MSSKQQEKLIELLRELFQLNQPDLDFGLYRIMHAKSQEIEQFLNEDLLATIQQRLGGNKAEKVEKAKVAYERERQNAIDYGGNPDTAPKAMQSLAEYKAAQESQDDDEDLYEQLYRFFERYYDGGDFLSRRYYGRETSEKGAPYAVPYDGSEVYSSSSWLSMMSDRLDIGMRALADDGVLFASIGDEEQENLASLIRDKYGKERFFSTLVWEKKKKGSFLNGSIARMKDYILCVSKKVESFSGLIGEIASETETYPCINASNARDTRVIKPGISSKFREKDYERKAGEIISSGNMNIVLLSDLVIRDGVLASELIVEGNWRYSQESMDG